MNGVHLTGGMDLTIGLLTVRMIIISVLFTGLKIAEEKIFIM